MPTAAKLVAALCLAALGFITSQEIKQIMPEGTAFGIFSELNAAIGFLVGWTTVGRRAGRGMAVGLSNGITGTAALVFWALFVQATNEMVGEAMANRYDGPVEAIGDIFAIGVEFAAILVDRTVLITLAVGAIGTGFLSEIAARVWR